MDPVFGWITFYRKGGRACSMGVRKKTGLLTIPEQTIRG